MACVVMAYIVMACTGMAYMVMAGNPRCCSRSSVTSLCSDGVCSYGLYSCGLHGYGLYGHGRYPKMLQSILSDELLCALCSALDDMLSSDASATELVLQVPYPLKVQRVPQLLKGLAGATTT